MLTLRKGCNIKLAYIPASISTHLGASCSDASSKATKSWMLLDQPPTRTPKLRDYFPLNMVGSHHLRGNLLWIHSLLIHKELRTSCCVQEYLWPWARKLYFISSSPPWVPASDPDVGDTELWFPALFILQMSLVAWSR